MRTNLFTSFKNRYVSKHILLTSLLLIPFIALFSQSGKVLTVPAINGTTQWGGITFNVTTTSTIHIDTLFVNTSGIIGNSNNLEVWYRPSAINGQPTTAEFIGTTRIYNNLISSQSVPSGINLAPIVLPASFVMQANSTYGFYIGDPAFSNTGIRFGSASATIPVNSVTDGTVTISIGYNVGYGWVRNGTATNYPRYFAGGVSYGKPISGDNNAGVLSIDSPKVFCAGNNSVYSTIINDGTNQIDTLTINWEVNGIAQPPLSYTQLIDTLNGVNPSTVQVLLGSANFSTGSSIVKVYTSMPNNKIDTNNLNDTVAITISTASTPTSITTTNTTLNSIDITVNGLAGAVDYEYGTSGFTLGTGTLSSATTHTFTISGLIANTAYDIYVRSNCGSTDLSAWLGPINFRTSNSIPFSENFENFSVGQIGTSFTNGWKSTASIIPRWESEVSTGNNVNTSGNAPYLMQHYQQLQVENIYF